MNVKMGYKEVKLERYGDVNRINVKELKLKIVITKLWERKCEILERLAWETTLDRSGYENVRLQRYENTNRKYLDAIKRKSWWQSCEKERMWNTWKTSKRNTKLDWKEYKNAKHLKDIEIERRRWGNEVKIVMAKLWDRTGETWKKDYLQEKQNWKGGETKMWKTSKIWRRKQKRRWVTEAKIVMVKLGERKNVKYLKDLQEKHWKRRADENVKDLKDMEM